MATQWRETIHGIEYIIESTEKCVERGRRDQCTNLVSIGTLVIPCFQCSIFFHFDLYLNHYQQLLSNLLIDNHGFPHSCANRVARDVRIRVLRPVTFGHRCNTLFYTNIYFVEIKLRQPESTDAIDRDLMESSEDDEPITKPASISYVLGLFRERDEKEKEKEKEEGRGSCSANHDCSICIEEIDKSRNALSLPCLHMFHETCLVRWLETSHVCPLCRLELPTED